MKALCIRLFYLFWYFFATALILAAVLVSLARLTTPLLNQHRAEIEAWASERLQVPITIQDVHADWRGYIPELTLTQVVMLDKVTKKPAFAVREIKLGLQLFASLWQRSILLEDIILAGAQVTVLQDANGKISIKDLPLQEKGANDQAYQLMDVAQWASAQPYLAFLDMQIHYLPTVGEERNLNIKKVTLINTPQKHLLGCSLVLQQELPTQVKAHLEWKGSLTQLESIQAKAYLKLDGISLAQWLKGKPFAGWQVQQGTGSAELWLDWSNLAFTHVQSIFKWYDLELNSDFDHKTYTLTRLRGHAGWRRQGQEQQIAASDLVIDFPNHLWPVTSFRAIVATDPQNQAYVKAFDVGYLDVEDLAPLILANASLPASWRATILALQPYGQIYNLSFARDANVQDIAALRLSAELRNVAFHPWQNYPGVGNLSAFLAWNGSDGELNFNDHPLSLNLPAIFAQTLNFDKVGAAILFALNNQGGWEVQVNNFELRNADLLAKAHLKLDIPHTEAATIDLRSELAVLDVGHVARYLPLKVFAPDFSAWLAKAFTAGKLENGKIEVHGKLNEFPFDPAKITAVTGVAPPIFAASGKVKDLSLRFSDDWPQLQKAEGSLAFNGTKMTVALDSAQLLNIPLTQITGVIKELGVPSQTLEMQGKISTDLSAALSFIHKSPLEAIIGKRLSSIALQGPMELELTLNIPLQKIDALELMGLVDMRGATFSLPALNFTLSDLKGDWEFTESDLSAEGLEGNLWSKPTRIDIATKVDAQEQKSLLATLAGTLDMQAVAAFVNLPLTSILKGQTPYRADVTLDDKASQIHLTTDLQGVEVTLPQPLQKAANEARATKLDFLFNNTPKLQTKIHYGNLIDAQVNVSSYKGLKVIEILSDRIAGSLNIPYPLSAHGTIVGTFDKIALAEGGSTSLSTLNPQAVPPLSLACRHLSYGGRDLGTFNLSTHPKANGMLIQNLSLSANDYTFRAKGQWTQGRGMQYSQLSGNLDSTNLSQFFKRMNVEASSLVVKNGKANFDLQWLGAPYNFGLGAANGSLAIALEKGRIIHLDASNNSKMGVGRLFSIFSLQTLPRRMKLDFSDLVEQGYSFDYVRGAFNLKGGEIYTVKETVLEGPVAHISAEGRIGLLAKDYDLEVKVTPHLTDSLPIVAGALTLNPFVGAAAWLVEKAVLSKQVSKVTTYTYKVTGPWSNPNWSAQNAAKS